MAGNFPNGAQDLVYTGNNHSNEKEHDQDTPSLYVDLTGDFPMMLNLFSLF